MNFIELKRNNKVITCQRKYKKIKCTANKRNRRAEDLIYQIMHNININNQLSLLNNTYYK